MKANSIIKVLFILLSSFIYPQNHILYWNNGTRTIGELDTTNISTTSLRFKIEDSKVWTFIHISEVKQVKSNDGTILYKRGCIGNNTSMLYHLPYVKHLPDKDLQQKFISEQDAQSNGYAPCKACFDDRSKLSYFHLEQQIAKQTALTFQMQNEILYEHVGLHILQATLDNVLDNWPESLKEYDYRIQIYKDKDPNALAVPQGNIYVSTGLLNIIEDPDELESIIAHEVAHVERRHGLQQYFDNQKKENAGALAALLAGVVVAAVGGDASDIALAVGITATVANIAVELAKSGYSRKLEEQADIFAQLLYFKQGKSSKSLISTLDKLNVYGKTRNIPVDNVNAYSDHPALSRRIKQAEYSIIFEYETPITLSLNAVLNTELPANFVEIKIKYLYKAESSTKRNEDIYYLIGSMSNNHPEISFRLEDIKLYLLANGQTLSLNGISGTALEFNSDIDFISFVNIKKENSALVGKMLKDSKFIPKSATLTSILIQRGQKSIPLSGLGAIQCSIVKK